jgi:hypothetical protein
MVWHIRVAGCEPLSFLRCFVQSEDSHMIQVVNTIWNSALDFKAAGLKRTFKRTFRPLSVYPGSQPRVVHFATATNATIFIPDIISYPCIHRLAVW